jgi:ADP-L-glycero-D-manno-heptose 6-epimerase
MAMIIVTGAAGFIGSCMINKLNNKGFGNIVAVDDFSRKDKMGNLNGKAVVEFVHRNDFFRWFEEHHSGVESIYHLGARTDTTETDQQVFDTLNLNYSKQMFKACAAYSIPLIYASSAATYGSGELGYLDDHTLVSQLRPLNAYGVSKNDFDHWVLSQYDAPPFWAGMKFFNVYGPNEYHKGRMASVVFHAYRQIRDSGVVTLFRSHRPEYADGEQLRDFIYVKDVVSVLLHLMVAQPDPGLYNLGAGEARSFNELVKATFAAAQQEVNINYVDTPSDIREKYQYFTCAAMEKLRRAGYRAPFFSLEEGISDYVQTYLKSGSYY